MATKSFLILFKVNETQDRKGFMLNESNFLGAIMSGLTHHHE